MGQYYKALTMGKGKVENLRCLAVQMEGEKDFRGQKLMKHAWTDDDFVKRLFGKLFRNPTRVAWVGDYADTFKWQGVDVEPDIYVNGGKVKPKSLWHQCWGDNPLPEQCLSLHVDLGVGLRGNILLNHDKKQYIDGSEWLKRCTVSDGKFTECLHPLPLLTACGNGEGGGDYRGVNEEKVGDWCWDLLEVRKKGEQPKDFVKVEYTFKYQ